MQDVVTINDFTKDEIRKAMLLLIKNDISYAIEFAQLLKKETKENTQILGEIVHLLKIGEIEKAKKLWQKYWMYLFI